MKFKIRKYAAAVAVVAVAAAAAVAAASAAVAAVAVAIKSNATTRISMLRERGGIKRTNNSDKSGAHKENIKLK